MDLKTYLERLKQVLKVRVLLKEITQKEANDAITSETKRWAQRLPGRVRPDAPLGLSDRFFTRIDGLPDWLQESVVDIAQEDDLWDDAIKELKSELNVRLGLGLSVTEQKYTSLDEMETLYKEQQKVGVEKAKVGEIETKGTQRKYWETVMPMLNARISSGQISYTDVQKLIKDTNELIALGVDPRALPEYNQAQAFQNQIQTQAMQMRDGQIAATSQQDLSMEELDRFIRSREETLGKELQDYITRRQTPPAPAQSRQPRNWIEYWQIQRGIDPDIEPLSKAQKWESFIGQQNETLQNLEAWSEVIERTPPMVKGSSYYNLAQSLPIMLDAQRKQVAELKTARTEVLSQSGMGDVQPLATPVAESWLERLVPGQKTGQPLTKPSAVPTPSGQQWQNLLPSEREKFAGYLDWAKVDVDDILFQMKRSLPETPAGAGRWNPIRQRGS